MSHHNDETERSELIGETADVSEREIEMNDVDYESEDEMGSVGSLQAKVKKLRTELAEAKAKRDEYLDGWQRCKADGVNARKELLASADRAAQRAREGVVEDIIPVLDSFDMATMHESWDAVNDSWRSGIDQIRNQLLGVLTNHGVERYGKVGDMYDHALHEVVQEQDDVAGEPGEIVRILRYGYRGAEHIIRAAQVIVKK